MDSYVKYLFVRFKKARLISWARERYIENENRMEEEVKSAYLQCARLLESGQEQEAMKIQDYYKFEPQYDVLFDIIKSFTLKPPNKENMMRLIPLMNEIGVVVTIGDDELSFVGAGLNFSVFRFSEVEPDMLNILGDIETTARGGKCHPYSILTAMSYNKCKEFTTHFVTGRVYQLSEKFKYLHSWVEISDGEHECVIDASKNIFMKKEPYYELNHVEEVQKVPASDIVTDYSMIRKLTDYNNIVAKVYYENADNGRFLYNTLVKRGEIVENQPNQN